MSFFQLILFISAGIIFFIFFKKLFNGDYPKRGIDFKSSLPDEQIGGVSSPDKIFSKPKQEKNRIDTLVEMADSAVERGDMIEALKALQSALIIEPENVSILQKAGYVELCNKNYQIARELYEKVLSLDEMDDLAHSSLANIMHKQGSDDDAIKHHKKAIEIDSSYANHYFNYANTLFDINRYKESLVNYKKAFELDSSLDEANNMILRIEKMDNQ